MYRVQILAANGGWRDVTADPEHQTLDAAYERIDGSGGRYPWIRITNGKGEVVAFFKESDAAFSSFKRQRRAFVSEALALRAAWEKLGITHAEASVGYPSYLPSFDEFVNDLLAWRDHKDSARNPTEGC